MTAQSFLLVALLALGIQLPAASGMRKGEKPGACPLDDGPCLVAPDQCVDDSQCPLKMKCCYHACFRQCVHKVSVKQGSCPQDRLLCLSPVQHLCHKDADCSGAKRCCLSACGRDCRNPTRG
ncbi:WAP four-disulfide core domain protein 5 [Manis javanica]|uniref:WAP four-disulfide core domain protein 5 n=1 Tax=Manis javanica TaxID=9974 RepID=UPI0018793DCB|nr:WAP four-disulfide core domain protein 5 [Manis javanica]KAI5940455.1 WAP four-disulfide core domain protein 5 [Manis javanica]